MVRISKASAIARGIPPKSDKKGRLYYDDSTPAVAKRTRKPAKLKPCKPPKKRIGRPLRGGTKKACALTEAEKKRRNKRARDARNKQKLFNVAMAGVI